MFGLLRSIYLRTVYPLLRPIIDRIIIYNLFHTTSIIATYIHYNKKYKAVKQVKKGFKDHRPLTTEVTPNDQRIIKRLADAYIKAKESQKSIGPPYNVSVLWQNTIDEQYAELDAALKNNDIAMIQSIMTDFSRNTMSASQGGGVDYFNNKKKLFYKYLFINTWYKYFNMCREVTDEVPAVTYPLVGNPAGLYYNEQVIPIEAIRFYYCAKQMSLLLNRIPNPVICEIGGGNGGQTYAFLSNFDNRVTYINIDLPEMLIIATYFLMKTFPEKNFLLYGEDEIDSLEYEKYDIILMPHFVTPQLRGETVDLFFNQRSFSEMDARNVREYINQIERICRHYFLHINHSKKFVWSENGVKSENLPSTEVKPNTAKFKKIYEYPWMFNRLEEEYNYKGTGFIAQLYEKVNA